MFPGVATKTKGSLPSSLRVATITGAPLLAFRTRSSQCSAVWPHQCTCLTKTKNRFPRARSKPSSRHRRTVAAQVSNTAPGLDLGSYKTTKFPVGMSPLLTELGLREIDCPRSVLAGRTKYHQWNWQQITSDPWVLDTITGYQLELRSTPSQSHHPISVVPADKAALIEEEVRVLQQKGAITSVQAGQEQIGFYSTLFLRSSKEGAGEDEAGSESAFQDGRSSCSQGSASGTGLDVQSRSQGRIFCNPYLCTASGLPLFQLEQEGLPVYLPSFWTLHSTKSVHENDAYSSGVSVSERSPLCDLPRRPVNHGRH